MPVEYDAPAFFDLMAYVTDADHDVIDMVSGNPDWEPPDALREAIRAYADASPEEFQYPPTEGLVELREEIAARRNVDVDQVVVTVGGGEALYLAIALGLEDHPGSEALLTDPVYPYNPGTVKMLGGTVGYAPAERDGSLDPEVVRECASAETAVIVANSPNNPTGAVYDEATMRGLVGAAEEVDAMLVSDEAYSHLDLSGSFASALGVDSAHRMVATSFSKSLAITGFRVGYAVFPSARLASAARDRHMLTLTAGVRPSQYAVLHALRNTPPSYYDKARELLRGRIETFTGALDAAGAEYTTPQGAFYVMTRFEGFPGSMENVKRLIDEAGVAGMPGGAFGETKADWFRFALVTDRVDEAADRLVEYFE